MTTRPDEGIDLLSTLTRRVLFAPLADHGRAGAVAERLRTAITLGILAENEQLPSETTLAAQFNISPVTLRDALTALRADGLVTTRRGRGGGTVVSGPLPDQRRVLLDQVSGLSSIDLRDQADWRRAVSVEAARLAARRASREDIGLLERGSANARSATDAVSARRADSRYFIQLAAASQSSQLSAASIRLQVEYAPVLTLTYAEARTREDVAALLTTLTTAVQDADVEAAGLTAARVVDLVASRAASLRANGWKHA
ncbi:GntR family transcriptional regulator [Aeromicrobium endophyticum]|uniref:GntR family transcriptional regulator n=1 Tax=Aeromicrobium endophyticum TaxID=2292704 RepID=A0A371P8D3_9ACTN|nr:GntR family transcriptional regulator [Aeromicrobium endophyticum]REK72224.1 GntR family transcriptional regulator [Aeromicrobium endophyticum]